MHVSLFYRGGTSAKPHVTCLHFPFTKRERPFSLSILITEDILRDAMITHDALQRLRFEAEQIQLDYGLC